MLWKKWALFIYSLDERLVQHFKGMLHIFKVAYLK